MKELTNREKAFASQNYDPNAVTMTGVPEHIVEAAKAFINLCVAHDVYNPDFQPDYTNSSQPKFEAVHVMGSPSGGGFRFHGAVRWCSVSIVGARLVSKDGSTANRLAEDFEEDYKALKVYERPSASK